jgi:hypothetical protein
MANAWYLADFAGAMEVSFERFAEAARGVLGREPGRGSAAEQDWFVKHAHYEGRERYDYRHRMERVEEQLESLKARTDFVEPANFGRHPGKLREGVSCIEFQ